MKVIEITGKTINQALKNALLELNSTEDKVKYEVLDEGSKGFLNLIGTKPAKIRVTLKKDYASEARHFLGNVLKAMGIDVEIEVQEDNEALRINIVGTNMGTVIGYRGETLDSLQYLTSLAINKGENATYKRVILDTENYRHKREETLKRLANKTAYKVKKYKRSVKLEPMNPYERRLIHAALQNDPEIVTYSDGEEPYRRIVIELKK